jgi:hypothetical protein
LLAKVLVEGKGIAHDASSHDMEAAAIYEAHSSTAGSKQRVLRLPVILLTNPVHVESRENVPV